jgi:phospholipid/cholesterol/gamma-HCH transport system permease protein
VRFDWTGLPDALRAPLALALPAQGASAEPIPAESSEPGLMQVLRHHGRDALTTAAFIGEVALSLGRLLRGRAVMRGSDLVRQIDLAGPLSLPIVSLTCFLIGLMLAYMGGAQLQRIGAQSFIADVVTVGMVRELAGLMTGVILAGRIGAAFAAQIGSMHANEEIDALRAMGIDPIDYLVLPRLLAMLAMAPLLFAWSATVGVLAGLPPVVGIYGVPAWEYLHKCAEALNWTHLWIGLFKGTMYIVLVALAGCREGLHAGRDAQAVGAATTTAVVKALLWIVIAASASTVLFQSLGL